MRSIETCLLAAALAGATPLTAATTCVGTSAELEVALGEASQSAEDDLIQVRAGTYVVPALSFQYQSDQPGSLTVRGGYQMGPGICVRFPRSPESLLDGQDTKQILFVNISSESEPAILIEHLTFYRGFSAGFGGGVYLNGPGHHSRIRFNRFLANHALMKGGALSGYLESGSLRVSNNLFANNGASDEAGAAWFQNSDLDPDAMIFDGNTVVDNHSDEAGGVLIGASSPLVVNNILWRNDGVDLKLLAPTATLERNNVAEVDGPFESALGNLNADPLFVAGGYTLRPDSPLLEQGTDDVVTLPLVDLAGLARVSGEAVDIGAYELGFIFLDSFESGDTSNWPGP